MFLYLLLHLLKPADTPFPFVMVCQLPFLLITFDITPLWGKKAFVRKISDLSNFLRFLQRDVKLKLGSGSICTIKYFRLSAFFSSDLHSAHPSHILDWQMFYFRTWYPSPSNSQGYNYPHTLVVRVWAPQFNLAEKTQCLLKLNPLDV